MDRKKYFDGITTHLGGEQSRAEKRGERRENPQPVPTPLGQEKAALAQRIRQLLETMGQTREKADIERLLVVALGCSTTRSANAITELQAWLAKNDPSPQPAAPETCPAGEVPLPATVESDDGLEAEKRREAAEQWFKTHFKAENFQNEGGFKDAKYQGKDCSMRVKRGCEFVTFLGKDLLVEKINSKGEVCNGKDENYHAPTAEQLQFLREIEFNAEQSQEIAEKEQALSEEEIAQAAEIIHQVFPDCHATDIYLNGITYRANGIGIGIMLFQADSMVGEIRYYPNSTKLVVINEKREHCLANGAHLRLLKQLQKIRKERDTTADLMNMLIRMN